VLNVLSYDGVILPLCGTVATDRPIVYLPDDDDDYHHHHHWLNSPMWTLAILRSFYQLMYPAIASSGFVTRVFSRVGLSAPLPTPGCPGGPMFSVGVIYLS
jgi:hypothetical protein